MELSDPPYKQRAYTHRLVCLSVYIVSLLYLRTCSCSLKVTFGMDQNESLLGMSKGLCIRLLCVRVGLCCTLGRITQYLPKLVK